MCISRYASAGYAFPVGPHTHAPKNWPVHNIVVFRQHVSIAFISNSAGAPNNPSANKRSMQTHPNNRSPCANNQRDMACKEALPTRATTNTVQSSRTKSKQYTCTRALRQRNPDQPVHKPGPPDEQNCPKPRPKAGTPPTTQEARTLARHRAETCMPHLPRLEAK